MAPADRVLPLVLTIRMDHRSVCSLKLSQNATLLEDLIHLRKDSSYHGRIRKEHLLYLHHLDILVLLAAMVVVHLVVGLLAVLQTLELRHWIYSDLLRQNR